MKSRDVEIRASSKSDVSGVRTVNESAFETPAEANLVDCLQEHSGSLISLVAEERGEIVGHILFSPVTLEEHSEPKLLGLAPMAVLPGRQRRGIGSALVRAGLERCRETNVAAVVVLGHPEFYSRFGFVPASKFGIQCEYDVPDEVFLATELESGGLSGRAGLVRYHPAFREL